MIERILVALDGSVRAPGVLAAAAELALKFDALLIPFRSVDIPPEFPPAAHMSHRDSLPQYLDGLARAELTELTRGCSVPHAAPLVGHGQAWRAILEAAERYQVDLIVLGSHGYGGVDRLLGTTAARVANLAKRNVLVVHEVKGGTQ